MITSNRSPLLSNRAKNTNPRSDNFYRHSSTLSSQNCLAEIFPCDNPHSPSMTEPNQRRATFKGWPNHIKASVEELVEAGFIYLGVQDKLKCFYCNGGLQRWQKDENPFFEHAKWYPNCEYVLRKKGLDFVQKVAGRFPDLKRPIPTNTSQSYILPVTSQTGVASSSLFSSGQSTQRPAMVAADNFSFSNISRDTVRKAMESERVKQTIAMGFDEDMVYELVKRKFSDEKKEYSSVLELVEDLQIEEEKAPSSFSDESQFSLYSCSTNSSENQRPESFASTSYSSSFKNEQSNILDSVGSDTSESVPSTSKDPVDLLQNMIDERTCKVCLDRVSNCVFQPCGHVCCCVSCSSALKKCPICRQTLHKVYKFYR